VNVVIVTTASRGAGSRTTDHRPHTLIVDEIHQTSAELELCLPGKRRTVVHLALRTVDPAFYARYLESARCWRPARSIRAPGPGFRRAKDVEEFLDDRYLRHVIRDGAACGVRADGEVERLAAISDGGEALGGVLPTAASPSGHPPFLEGTVENRSPRDDAAGIGAETFPDSTRW